MRKLLIAVLALGFAAGLSAPQSSAAEGAVAFVEQLSADVLDTMREEAGNEPQREERLHGLLLRGLDLPGIGRFVLGSHWSEATPQQIEEYQDLFTAYLLRTYSRLLQQQEVKSFTVTASDVAEDGDVLVHTSFQLNDGQPREWAWRVRTIDGKPRIVDLLKDGVSMAQTYRSEFGAVADSSGIEGLIDALRRKAAQAQAPAVGAVPLAA